MCATVLHRDWNFGDLSEIWDRQFDDFNHDMPQDLAEHVIPINRVAGKFAPAYLRREDYPAMWKAPNAIYPTEAVAYASAMIVLRLPLK